MERKIGEIFACDNKQYATCLNNIQTADKCNNCDLNSKCYASFKCHGWCSDVRSDKREVIFKEISRHIEL